MASPVGEFKAACPMTFVGQDGISRSVHVSVIGPAMCNMVLVSIRDDTESQRQQKMLQSTSGQVLQLASMIASQMYAGLTQTAGSAAVPGIPSMPTGMPSIQGSIPGIHSTGSQYAVLQAGAQGALVAMPEAGSMAQAAGALASLQQVDGRPVVPLLPSLVPQLQGGGQTVKVSYMYQWYM